MTLVCEFGWLFGQLVSRLVGWSVGWSVGQLVGRLVSRLVGRSVSHIVSYENSRVLECKPIIYVCEKIGPQIYNLMKLHIIQCLSLCRCPRLNLGI